ncbi:MAG: efflux RND transporter periplasmic adaptor subunit [Vicinamibacterales bacterium]
MTKSVTEASLTTITLTPEAVTRLGIETAPVEERGVTRSRVLGGDVVPAGGAQITITAPFAGTLDAERGPAVGSTVTQGATLARLVPLAPADRDVRVEAERAVNEAAGRHVLAAQRQARATKLAAEGAGSQRAAEEAQADLAVADAALKAARDRLALAARGVNEFGGLALTAPAAAVVQAAYVGPGQAVANGAPLFDLVRLDSVWVRVPLYAGDLAQVDRRAPVRILPLGGTGTGAGMTANPVQAPPSADPSTAAVDLYYAIVNPGGALRPGERVSVRLPLTAATRSLVVPRAALLYDANGGSWVYEARPDHVFVRRRVSVVDAVEDVAVLDQGPAPGTRVVTAGAAELFGTEFGAGK